MLNKENLKLSFFKADLNSNRFFYSAGKLVKVIVFVLLAFYFIAPVTKSVIDQPQVAEAIKAINSENNAGVIKSQHE